MQDGIYFTESEYACLSIDMCLGAKSSLEQFLLREIFEVYSMRCYEMPTPDLSRVNLDFLLILGYGSR
jgi:hypothetical protein